MRHKSNLQKKRRRWQGGVSEHCYWHRPHRFIVTQPKLNSTRPTHARPKKQTATDGQHGCDTFQIAPTKVAQSTEGPADAYLYPAGTLRRPHLRGR